MAVVTTFGGHEAFALGNRGRIGRDVEFDGLYSINFALALAYRNVGFGIITNCKQDDDQQHTAGPFQDFL
ncbi:hypothetical protein D3C87_2088290 [compost metagenome]